MLQFQILVVLMKSMGDKRLASLQRVSKYEACF